MQSPLSVCLCHLIVPRKQLEEMEECEQAEKEKHAFEAVMRKAEKQGHEMEKKFEEAKRAAEAVAERP